MVKLICNTYSGDDSENSYNSLDEAQQAMREEVDVEYRNLLEEGYDNASFTIEENSSSVYTPGDDIYYDWKIEL